ncbi:MAG: response regulator [Actinobacteria bacterium]|nr:response regulator [Actinomycetota bacterium]
MRVLIVEDETKLAGLLRRGLVEESHAADVAGSGEDALWMARAIDYDAIVLDLMLPGIDGFEICRRLRAGGVLSPSPSRSSSRAYARSPVAALPRVRPS